MNEWIILVWFSVCPINHSFYSGMVCKDGMLQNFYVSTSTERFNEKWNSLSGDNRNNSHIFKGSEFKVKEVLENISLTPISTSIHPCPGNPTTHPNLIEYSPGMWRCPVSGVIWTSKMLETE